jgi:hypothetical protein
MWPLSLRYPHQISVCTSPVSHTYYKHRLLCSKKNIRPRLLGRPVRAQSLNRMKYPGRWCGAVRVVGRGISSVLLLTGAVDRA